MPLFEQGRIILPTVTVPDPLRPLHRRPIDALVEEEYMAFPVSTHDDMLDCLARIEDPDCRGRSLAGTRVELQGLAARRQEEKIKDLAF